MSPQMTCPQTAGFDRRARRFVAGGDLGGRGRTCLTLRRMIRVGNNVQYANVMAWRENADAG